MASMVYVVSKVIRNEIGQVTKKAMGMHNSLDAFPGAILLKDVPGEGAGEWFAFQEWNLGTKPVESSKSTEKGSAPRKQRALVFDDDGAFHLRTIPADPEKKLALAAKLANVSLVYWYAPKPGPRISLGKYFPKDKNEPGDGENLPPVRPDWASANEPELKSYRDGLIAWANTVEKLAMAPSLNNKVADDAYSRLERDCVRKAIGAARTEADSCSHALRELSRLTYPWAPHAPSKITGFAAAYELRKLANKVKDVDTSNQYVKQCNTALRNENPFREPKGAAKDMSGRGLDPNKGQAGWQRDSNDAGGTAQRLMAGGFRGMR